jgi:pimeloyl-ACP methyl ester carboxylesterase
MGVLNITASCARCVAPLLVCSVLLAQTTAAQRGSIHKSVPTTLDRSARYLFYLHGRIIEDKGPRPTDSRWGVYEYQQILEEIASDGVIVISEQRPPNTDMDRFAAHVVDQVDQLLRAGVPPEHVTVVGFSKGGSIAIRTSARLQNPRVNFVLLAACGDGDFSRSNLTLWGRTLSIYEASDEIGRSCAALFSKSGATGERREMQVAIGGGHGAFYRPHSEWLMPLRRWAASPREPLNERASDY